MGAIRYSCPIRLNPTYTLPAKDIRLLGKFQPDSFKTERLDCVETEGQTDMARSTRLVMLINNIYTLWSRKRPLHCCTVKIGIRCEDSQQIALFTRVSQYES